jgi:hypothetical protein
MKEILWGFLARLLAKPAVTQWLINRAVRTPYLHLTSPDGNDLYMARFWLFNPYDRVTHEPKYAWCPWSIRLHHIHREDQDRHPHNHPWDARTIILRGWYHEQRILGFFHPYRARLQGDTAPLKFGEYHRITEVAPEGAVTLFISGPYQGTWGFLVDGVKVHWKKYLGLAEDEDLQPVNLELQG